MSRACLVIAAVIALMGATTTATAATPCTAPAKYSRVDRAPYTVSNADVYRDSCRIARALGPKRVARDLGIRSSNEAVICLEYAKTSYRPLFHSPAYAGCMRGFALRR